MRKGFTLVELMVAMTILLILTALVIAAFRNNDTDRLSASARLVQAYIEGAKSRAISTGKPVGVRLIPSSSDPRVVGSLMYVGATDPLTGTLAISPNVGDDTDPGDDYWTVHGSVANLWGRLARPTTANPQGRDLIRPGTQIEIPRNSGRWYLVSADDYDPWGNSLRIIGHYYLSDWVLDPTIPQGGRWVLRFPTRQIHYRMELAPTVLANQEPMSLERGIVIDMDAGQIPSAWSTPGAHWEIVFGQRGRPESHFGVINLYVTRVADVELARGLLVDHPANGTSTPLATPLVAVDPPHTPQIEPILITIYGQTGLVTTSRVNLEDADGNQLADNPFDYALRGRESQ